MMRMVALAVKRRTPSPAIHRKVAYIIYLELHRATPCPY
jgi:hypothetical protein